MNLLKNTMPSAVTVGGISFKIDTRYSTALRILDALGEQCFSPEERQDIALSLFYIGAMPEPKELATAVLFNFLDCKDLDNVDFSHLTEKKPPQKPLIDFEKDGTRIYTAILRVYGIDLQKEPVHWWQFSAMLQDLGEKTALQSVISIRTMDMKDVPEKDRAKIRALKREFALEVKEAHVETLEERNRRWLGV